MAPRTVNVLSNIEIDEISLVDRPANQHARVTITKRAEEDAVSEYFSEDGTAIADLDSLEVGSVVYDGEGNGFVVDLDTGEDAELDESQQVPEMVGKSLAEQVREDLSKAFTDVERDDVIAKALTEVSKAEQRAQAAEEIAKSERDLRLGREYIAKAAEYGVAGVTPDELGPVLMRMAETMPYEDCAVIHKALTSAGEAFAELGFSGGAAGDTDPMGVVDAVFQEIGKSADGLTREAAVSKAFEMNPAAYDDYLASRRG